MSGTLLRERGSLLKGGFDLKLNDASGYDFLDGGIVGFGYGWEGVEGLVRL